MNTFTIERVDADGRWTRIANDKTEVWVYRNVCAQFILYTLPAGDGWLYPRSSSDDGRALGWTDRLRHPSEILRGVGELTAHLRALEILGA